MLQIYTFFFFPIVGMEFRAFAFELYSLLSIFYCLGL